MIRRNWVLGFMPMNGLVETGYTKFGTASGEEKQDARPLGYQAPVTEM